MSSVSKNFVVLTSWHHTHLNHGVNRVRTQTKTVLQQEAIHSLLDEGLLDKGKIVPGSRRFVFWKEVSPTADRGFNRDKEISCGIDTRRFRVEEVLVVEGRGVGKKTHLQGQENVWRGLQKSNGRVDEISKFCIYRLVL